MHRLAINFSLEADATNVFTIDACYISRLIELKQSLSMLCIFFVD
jgi:hypothetical protein